MTTERSRPRPQVSPDGYKYWDGSDWKQMPGKVCEWDGFGWKVKPSGVESEWDGSDWIAEPSGVPSRWNGHEWAMEPRGESEWDGSHYIPKPVGVESAWDGTEWLVKPDGVESRWDWYDCEWRVKPEGRAYWEGNVWVVGRRPIVKFGIPILIVLLLAGAVVGGLKWKSASDAQARLEAEQIRLKEQEKAVGWTNEQSQTAMRSFLRSFSDSTCADAHMQQLDAGGLSQENIAAAETVWDTCIKAQIQAAVPPNARGRMKFAAGINPFTQSYAINVSDPLGKKYFIAECQVNTGGLKVHEGTTCPSSS